MDLETRYPELLAFAQFFPSGDAVDWKRWETRVESEASVIYLYGFSPYIDPFIEWLNEDSTRDLVIIEDRVEAIRQMQEEGATILANLQIHLKYKSIGVEFSEFIPSIVAEFPFSNIEVFSLHEEETNFREVKQLLLHNAVLEEAIYQEMLHHPKLAKNLFANFAYWEEAFDLGKWKGAFKGVPAIYVGAGPSLKGALPFLKTLGDKALLLAGGSAITALGNHSIFPHLTYAIDPNKEEFVRLAFQSSFDAPLIYGSRLCSEVFNSHRGPLGYYVTGTGGRIESWFEKEVGIEDPKITESLSKEALSVTTIALMSAIYMGCSPIILVGVDLAYGEGEKYAEGVISGMQSDLEKAETTSIENGFTTCTKWIMERDVIDDMAQKHPHIQFLRGSEGGLPFSRIPYEEDWGKYLKENGDLRGKIHHQIESTYLNIEKEKIEGAREKFLSSLHRCKAYIEGILEEYAKIYPNFSGADGTLKSQVLEMDLEEELAYDLALKVGGYALAITFRREARENTARNLYLIKTQIYKKMKSMIDEYLIIC